ncbi:MAG: type II toxin-antitoxin system PemK/MazF family toxin [Bryobacteraceae bacterium]
MHGWASSIRKPVRVTASPVPQYRASAGYGKFGSRSIHGPRASGASSALVLSPRSDNGKSGRVLVCLVTNQIKGYPFEVPLPSGCASREPSWSIM